MSRGVKTIEGHVILSGAKRDGPACQGSKHKVTCEMRQERGQWKTARANDQTCTTLEIHSLKMFLYMTSNKRCKIWGFHVGDYEECRLLGYRNPVRTSQETHYVSATEPSRLMLCKIWGFHGSDYEECRLLGYKNPVRTSQENITSPLQSSAS
jgi:hypothetical protein